MAVVTSLASCLRPAQYLVELDWQRQKRDKAEDPTTFSPVYLQRPKSALFGTVAPVRRNINGQWIMNLDSLPYVIEPMQLCDVADVMEIAARYFSPFPLKSKSPI